MTIKPTISAEELLQRVNVESNPLIASRMPPGLSCGLHPSGFYDIYERGGLMKEFQAQLGPAMPRPTFAFNAEAAPDAAPLASTYKPFTGMSS